MGVHYENGARNYKLRDAANVVRLVSSILGILVLLSSVVVAYHSVEQHEVRLLKLEEWKSRHSLRTARCVEKINSALKFKATEKCDDDMEIP